MENGIILSSWDDAVIHLQSLKYGTSLSVGSLLEAQIQILKFTQSPELVNSTFDTIFYSADKALKNCVGNQKEEIKEKVHLMCHSFIFFTKAKLEYEEACLQDEERKMIIEKYTLLSDAMTSIIDSINSITALSTGKGVQIIFDKKKLLEPFTKKEDGIIARFFKWWSKDELLRKDKNTLRQKKQEFSSMLVLFVEKLYRYREIIGPSFLISGIIENYQDIVIKQEIENFRNKLAKKVSQSKRNREDNPGLLLGLCIGAIVLVCIVALLLLIGHWIVNIFLDTDLLWNYLINIFINWPYAMYFILLCTVLSVVCWVISNVKYKKIKEEANEELKSFLVGRNEIYKCFHPYSENLFDVDKKMKEIAF